MGPHSAYKRPRLAVDVRPELTQPLRIDTRGSGGGAGGSQAEDKQQQQRNAMLSVNLVGGMGAGVSMR